MPTLRTNLLRLELNSTHTTYEVDLHSRSLLDQRAMNEIADYLNKAMPNVVYSFPFLYSTQVVTNLVFNMFLSNGQPVQIMLVKSGGGNSKEILPLIVNRLMTLTDLLYSVQLGSCFNPFQEKKKEDLREIPGFWLAPLDNGTTTGLYLVPQVIQFREGEEISEGSQVLLDYFTGTFYMKQNIVRLDKQRGDVHFRDGSIVQRKALRSLTRKNISGYPLANDLHHFLTRIKSASTSFCQSWGLKYDSKFLESNALVIQPGSITLRNNIDRSLAELITPMSEHNWIHNTLQFYRSNILQDIIDSQLVFFCREQQRKYVGQLTKQLESIKFRMGLKLSFKTILHKGLESIDELMYLLRIEMGSYHPNKIYYIPHIHGKNKSQRDQYDKLVQFLIDQNVLFHLVQVDINREYNYELQAYLQLSVFYTKMRLNPWKIKDIPFSNSPMAVMALDIQRNRQGLLSLSLISTMNIFLTKFTAVHKIIKAQTLHASIDQAIRECIGKFFAAHNRTPTRIFLFRTGVDQSEDFAQQYKHVKQSVYNQTKSLITYVCLSKKHPLRNFTQLDSNYFSKETCKKVQALLYSEIRNQLYFQLQLEEPMHKIQILEVQRHDPSFVTKILILMAKVIFAGVGNTYGYGLGVLDYPRKLNAYRQHNLQPWKGLLQSGIFPFL